MVFKSLPVFLRFKVEDVTVKWSLLLDLHKCKYRLCGMVYFGDYHFTSRIITADGEIYFNDAIKHGRSYQYEGIFNSSQLKKLAAAPNGRKLIFVFYIRME